MLDETIKNASKLTDKEYENCTFVNCDFSNVDFSGVVFSECEFEGCNLSNAITKDTAFRDVQFSSCKLLGIHFEACNEFLFEVGFSHCQLDFSCFFQRKMKKAQFTACSLVDVDFSSTDLSEAVLESCNLSGAVFDQTILTKTNLSTAENFNINPNQNRLNGAVINRDFVEGIIQHFGVELA